VALGVQARYGPILLPAKKSPDGSGGVKALAPLTSKLFWSSSNLNETASLWLMRVGQIGHQESLYPLDTSIFGASDRSKGLVADEDRMRRGLFGIS
jgi:hypothetical protein